MELYPQDLVEICRVCTWYISLVNSGPVQRQASIDLQRWGPFFCAEDLSTYSTVVDFQYITIYNQL